VAHTAVLATLMAPTEELFVQFGDDPVGRLRIDEGGRFCFAYDAPWRTNRDAFPISLSLPLRAEEYIGGSGHTFFANLLPEGGARQAVCRRLGISEANDFALLRAIGGECAGALSIVTKARPRRSEPRYEPLGDKRLQQLVESDDIVPLLIGGESTRLSLAGAQDKLPVTVIEGEIHLPIDGAPSTHILKLPNRRYAHLPINEAFVMELAARMGLDVVKTELCTRTNPPSLLVKRYDRRQSADEGPVVRLHQEDVCQALGLPPTQKYEQEGGPTLAATIELARSSVSQPGLDVLRLIQWQAFNVVAGNADGHGKNLSILYEGRDASIAPFYDLVSTRHYKGLDAKLAMSVGGSRDMGELHRVHWETLARDVGIAARVVIEAVQEIVERCTETLGSWSKEFRERYGKRPILQTLPDSIKRRARGVSRRLIAPTR